MSQEAVVWMLRLLFALVALVVVAVTILRPLWRMLRTRPDVDLLTPDFTAGLEGEELEIPGEAEDGTPDRGAIIDKARADPRQTAVLVQRWLKERR
jgi:flagellar biosynthesis/type III secretory pathway M-ring protein FliF/YscJ